MDRIRVHHWHGCRGCAVQPLRPDDARGAGDAGDVLDCRPLGQQQFFGLSGFICEGL